MFPFFLVLTALAGVFGSQYLADEAASLVLEAWPEEVAGPISREIHNVLVGAHGQVLTVGAVLALYFASSGIESLRIGLNRAYTAVETRSIWLLRLEFDRLRHPRSHWDAGAVVSGAAGAADLDHADPPFSLAGTIRRRRDLRAARHRQRPADRPAVRGSQVAAGRQAAISGHSARAFSPLSACGCSRALRSAAISPNSPSPTRSIMPDSRHR